MAPIDVVKLSRLIAEYLQSGNSTDNSTQPVAYNNESVSSTVSGVLAVDASPLGPVYFILAYLLFNTFVIFSCMIVNGIYKKATTDYERYKSYIGKASAGGGASSKKQRSRSGSRTAAPPGAERPAVPQNLPNVRASTKSKRKRFRVPKLHIRPPVSNDEEKEYNAVAWADADDPRYREM